MTYRSMLLGIGGTALIASSALVLILSSRLRTVAHDTRELQRRATLPHEGYVVPTFRAATFSGDSVVVGEVADTAARQVLFVFNTTCQFCRGMLPVWQELNDSLKRTGKSVQVFAVSLHPRDTTERYVIDHAIRYPVLNFPHPKLAYLYRAGAVPQTVVLNSRGTVLFARTGVLDRPSLDSVYAAVNAVVRR